MERLTTDKDYYADMADYKRHLKQGYGRRVGTERFLRLCEYEMAEEQGLLLRLPCKVEDTVYVIVKKDISPQKVVEIHRSCNGIEIMTNRRVFHVSAIGETVFLTREEAESALAEIRSTEGQRITEATHMSR